MSTLFKKFSNILFLLIGVIIIFSTPYINSLLSSFLMWPINLIFALIFFIIGIFIVYKFY